MAPIPEHGDYQAMISTKLPIRYIAAIAGLLFLLGVVLTADNPPLGLSSSAWKMVGVVVVALTLWASEAIPIGLTGVVIILLLIVLGILPFNTAFGFVADKINALILAGEILGVALAVHSVDKYLSLKILRLMGERTDRIVLGMMLATSFISMWIPNTAAATIMASIAVGILKLLNVEKGKSNFGKALMIGIAYAATIGGIGTPVGTPPVPITIGNIERSTGLSIGFTQWMVWGVPMAILLTLVAWFLLLRLYGPEVKTATGSAMIVEEELRKLGGLRGVKLKTLVLFLLIASLWMLDPLASMYFKDWTYIVSLLAIILLLTPGIGVLEWKDVIGNVDWGILLLIAGGLALGEGLKRSGVTELVSVAVSGYLRGYPPIIAIMGIALLAVLFIVVFCSITATSTFAVPLAIALAKGLGVNPTIAAIAAGIASCFAFLLPANTPPNAIAYSYGYFKNYEMVKAGAILILVSMMILTVFVLLYIPLVLGISTIF